MKKELFQFLVIYLLKSSMDILNNSWDFLVIWS